MEYKKKKIKYVKSSDRRSESFNTFINEKYPQFITEQTPDLVLVSGGDGAMLHAIQNYYEYKVPFLGHAAGTLNFLMNYIEDPKTIIGLLEEDKIPLHFLDATSITVEIQKNGYTKEFIGKAINEVVLGSHIMGYHGFIISSENSSFDNFEIKGTGVCISTDLGSTGYNFNLGGPILPLGSDLWAISGVVCNRYLNDIVNAQNIKINCVFPKDDIYIFIDGIRKSVKLGHEDQVLLSSGDKIKLAFLDKSEFIKKRIDITSRYRKG